MKLEAGKEMDRKCVLDWLNEVYFSPSVSYCKHVDDEIRILAHDALVLLKEQETANIYKCQNCGTWVSAENVVQCKDCEHCYFADNRIPSEQGYVCGRNGIDVTPDWYCADGERKPTQTNAKNNALDMR